MYDRAPSKLLPTASLFIANGVSLGSWVSRVPAARDALDLSVAAMGAVLFGPGLGALAGLPLAGRFVARVGSRRVLVAGGLGACAGLGTLAAGLACAQVTVVAVGLVVYGFSIGCWDVAVNVAGSALEHRHGRTLMPRLHAGQSLGVILGTACGAVAGSIGVSVVLQLASTAALLMLIVCVMVRGVPGGADPSAHGTGPPGLFKTWRERRTVAIGACVLAFALCEGIAGDWLALGLVDGHGYSQPVGAAAYVVFIAALTSGRAAGGVVLDRVGRVRSLRRSTVAVVAGVLLVVFMTSAPLVFVGAGLWGLGVSLGFPVGMSAAADRPDRAAQRVSVVSSIGYGAFFAGPPLVGAIVKITGMPQALLAVIAFALVAAATASSTSTAADPARQAS